jgi:hypothetical protein
MVGGDRWHNRSCEIKEERPVAGNSGNKLETATPSLAGLEQKDIGTVAQVISAGAAVVSAGAAVYAASQVGKPKK